MKYTPIIIPEKENENRAPVTYLKDIAAFAAGVAAIVLLFLSAVHLSIDYIIPHIPRKVDTFIGRALLKKFEYNKKFSSHSDNPDKWQVMEKKLQFITDRLAENMGLEAGFKVFIADVKEKNAVSLPGGIIVFYKDIISQADSENELAMIAGHELGHTFYRDHLRGLGSAVVYIGLSVILFGSDSSMNYFFSGLFNTVNNRFSQEQEIRADLFGLRALNSYYGHVGGALSFFEKMAGQKDFPFFTGMGTHPSFSKRVVILKKEIKKAGYAVKDTGPLEFHKKEKKGDNQF